MCPIWMLILASYLAEETYEGPKVHHVKHFSMGLRWNLRAPGYQLSTLFKEMRGSREGAASGRSPSKGRRMFERMF